MSDPDAYKLESTKLADPALSAVAVSPHDTNDITATRGLYIGVSGNVTVNMMGTGTSILFTAVPVGILPIRVTRVLATGTAATGIVAIY